MQVRINDNWTNMRLIIWSKSEYTWDTSTFHGVVTGLWVLQLVVIATVVEVKVH